MFVKILGGKAKGEILCVFKYVLSISSIHLQVISALIMKCLPIVEVVLADIAIVQVVVTLNCAGLAGSGAVEWRCWIM